MLISENVIIKWNSRNKKMYEDLGYKYTKMGDEFLVKISDVSKGSKAMVDIKCDYCGKVITRRYTDYLSGHDEELGDSCLDCKQHKTEITNLKRYGYKTSALNKDVISKKEQTILKKYGCKSYFQTDDFKEKSRRTCMDRYGVPYALQSESIKEKLYRTNISRYGHKCSLHSKLNKAKVISTNMRKYGVPYSLQSEMVRHKAQLTLQKNGTCRTSRQQISVCNMLSEIYGDCKLNYPCGRCSLDCVIYINDCKVDIEYDGVYWHQDEQKDRRRDEFVKSQGYKVLRIKARHGLPTKEQLKEAIDYLVKGNHSYATIKLDI